ncbi:MAG: hypothetical protein MJK04_19450 [Psychrosphaera sp.]|nr:hypothetical protein [Psychrosphaera sp.]
MKAIFEVNEKEFQVVFSLLGFEQYYYDGILLKKRWSFKFKDRLCFDINGEIIEFVISLSTKDWSIKVLKNGDVIVDELFPEIKAKIAQSSKSNRMKKKQCLKIC